MDLYRDWPFCWPSHRTYQTEFTDKSFYYCKTHLIQTWHNQNKLTTTITWVSDSWRDPLDLPFLPVSHVRTKICKHKAQVTIHLNSPLRFYAVILYDVSPVFVHFESHFLHTVLFPQPQLWMGHHKYSDHMNYSRIQ